MASRAGVGDVLTTIPIGYLETTFLPLRGFADRDGLKAQADNWLTKVAAKPHLRPPGRSGGAGLVGGAWLPSAAAGSAAAHCGGLPPTAVWLETRLGRDPFVRVAGADCWVPPVVARRVAIELSPT